ncbi:hypothetical protein SH668x_002967 [Planctomicrobium sp. SH668]|uniref:hypothetical protein n=1 Tax=Planctomicrobium sp. SH668 TaxID=3448126 RepID=UPI003F5B2695
MLQSVEQPTVPENLNTPLTIDQMQTVLDDYTNGWLKLAKRPQDEDLELQVALAWKLSPDSRIEQGYQLSDKLHHIGAMITAAAKKIDELNGFSGENDLCIIRPAGYSVSVNDNDFVELVVMNANDEEDALRQAEIALLDFAGGERMRRAIPAVPETPVTLQAIEKAEHRFRLAGDEFSNIDICIWNHASEASALSEAQAFIEWVQAAGAAHQHAEPERKIA